MQWSILTLILVYLAACSTTSIVSPDAQTNVIMLKGNLGDRIEQDGMALTVLSVDRSTQFGDAQTAKRNYDYLIVSALLEATRSSGVPYTSRCFRVKDDDGYTYYPYHTIPAKEWQNNQHVVGNTAQMTMVFEVPQEMNIPFIFYEPLEGSESHWLIRIALNRDE
jgi:hypothetical protein